MSMIDKLKFWKKPESKFDDFAMPAQQAMPTRSDPLARQGQDFSSGFDPLAKPMGQPGEPTFGEQQNFQSPSQPQFAPPTGNPSYEDDFQDPTFSPVPSRPVPVQPVAGSSSDQNHQIINSKLDTIKAQLELVLQRLDKLDQSKESKPYASRWER